MNIAGIGLILLVTVVLFGPDKLPMVARHLGKFVRRLQDVQANLSKFYHACLQEQILQENLAKAKQGDQLYQQHDRIQRSE